MFYDNISEILEKSLIVSKDRLFVKGGTVFESRFITFAPSAAKEMLKMRPDRSNFQLGLIWSRHKLQENYQVLLFGRKLAAISDRRWDLKF